MLHNTDDNRDDPHSVKSRILHLQVVASIYRGINSDLLVHVSCLHLLIRTYPTNTVMFLFLPHARIVDRFLKDITMNVRWFPTGGLCPSAWDEPVPPKKELLPQ